MIHHEMILADMCLKVYFHFTVTEDTFNIKELRKQY